MVCIFAEGAISRTGNLLPFKRGFERIVDGLDVPIIPVYLDRVWGSIFSFKRGKFFWKLPERLPYPVTVAFGDAAAVDVDRAATCARRSWNSAPRRWRTAAKPTDLLHTEFMRVGASGTGASWRWPTAPARS